MLRAMQHYTGLLGVLVILAIGYAFSSGIAQGELQMDLERFYARELNRFRW